MKPYQHQVQYYETDRMQCTHHSNYIRFMEEARLDFMAQMGWGYDKMEEEGIISPVVKVTCDYKKQTTYPQKIEINVKVIGLTPARLSLGYTMTVEGEVVCTGTSQHCFLDENGRPVSLKKRYPEFYSLLDEAKDE